MPNPMKKPWTIEPGDALVVVDVQIDFLPGGALAVPDGDAVIPVLNRYIDLFTAAGLPVFATRDWHPEGHCSFAAQGGPWPPHCIHGTEGARIAGGLHLPKGVPVISKGTDPDKDAYSGFQGTDLGDRLRREGVRRLFVGGLATDYCVLNTVKDALGEGFSVCLAVDAIRAVDAHTGDGRQAEATMARAGAVPVTLEGRSP
jgi:nicotinamidase/pyrazinamidase